MSRPVKIVLYVLSIAVAVTFGILTMNQFREASRKAQTRAQKIEAEDAALTETPLTNAAPATNAPATNAVATNALASETNAAVAAATNTEVATTPPPPAPVTAGTQHSYSKMISYGLLCVLGFAGFAVLLARDLSHLVAHKATGALFSDDGAPVDPEYEQAEELWKDGKHLEAIQAMRDYLNKHPREQYVALRIAEIYEQNLHNPLAAALEYEEVLKKNLPPERWGWAAIHLANIYSGKLGQPEKAVALLHRIDAEYGQTSAANKARERLAQIDPNFVSASASVPSAEAPAAESSAPASNLPPGFRPKS